MIKKLQHFSKVEKSERILFSEKDELDQILVYNIVFAVQNDVVYFITRDGDYYHVINFNGKYKEDIFFEELIRDYDLAIIDPADVVNISKKI